MTINFFCPRWGCEHLPFATFLDRVKAAGYDGVEMSLPLEEEERSNMLVLLAEYKLLFIAQHWETVDADFATHKKNYTMRLRNVAVPQALFVNSQTGKDYYTKSENRELMQVAAKVSQQTGVQIIHETHRGKWSFAAHITRRYLQKYPDIQLTLDISHWCNVAESFLHDQAEAIDLAMTHTQHLHARVGYIEGPQVPDPRAPEWKEALNIHLAWWDKIVAMKKAAGVQRFTITPEFGAPPYMILLPFSQQPIANQWDINLYMMQMLRERYATTNSPL